MIRSLSHSEIQTALTCELRHAYAYTGHATGGDVLKPKMTAPVLRDGRAWGRAVAAWHEHAAQTYDAHGFAYAALAESLGEDADEQRAMGVYDPEEADRVYERLQAMLNHYIATVDPLPIDRPEHELDVAIPSRTGQRHSNRYRFVGFLDGIHTDSQGRQWVVEFKLRSQLTPFKLIARDQQIRRYAWAAREALDIDPVGVIVDERWNEVPKPPRMLKSGKPSHDQRQLCTAADYERACLAAGEKPNLEALDVFANRRWQQRHPILFRPGELDDVGRQLVSAARLIHELDAGRPPIANPSRAHCFGCRFDQICPESDSELVDALYTSDVPKRDRQPKEVAA